MMTPFLLFERIENYIESIKVFENLLYVFLQSIPSLCVIHITDFFAN